MRRLFLLSLLLALILLPSCSPSDHFAGGRPITPEDLESISAEVFGTVEAPNETATAEPSPYTIVYWISESNVYHTHKDCAHLTGKLSIKQSTLQTATGKGLKPCKDCESK